MNLAKLILRGVAFHKAAHGATLCGMAIAAAVLTGALVTGDSVRQALQQKAMARLGGAAWSVSAGDRFFRQELRNLAPGAAPVLALPGAVQHASGKARANHARIFGVDHVYLDLGKRSPRAVIDPGSALLSADLMEQLGARTGDEIVLRIQRPTSLASESSLSPAKGASVGWRLKVAGVLASEQGGDIALEGSGLEAFNVIVPIDELAEQVQLPGKANLLLLASEQMGSIAGSCSPGVILDALRNHWKPEDAGIQVRMVPGGNIEVHSPRIFLDTPIVSAMDECVTNSTEILTYLVNLFEHGTNSTPYSMVTAAGPPYTTRDLRIDEIMLSEWLAEDLSAEVGDEIRLTYFLPDSGAALRESSQTFKVAGVVPPKSPHEDRTLMPEFPGIKEAERTHDWDAGFPLKHTIRQKDEDYWKERRGTPKAFISSEAGARIWSNRFGRATAVRFPADGTTPEAFASKLLGRLTPSDLGFTATDLRAGALAAANQAQDFGQLFLAFSIFIIFAALLLAGLLFQLSLETRSRETALLLASGFAPGRLRRVYMGEALALSGAGAVAGALLGVLYAKGLLWGLNSVWAAATGGLPVQLHLKAGTLLFSVAISTLLACAAAWFALRGTLRRSVVELFAGETEARPASSAPRWIGALGAVCLVCAILLVGWSLRLDEPVPALFFCSGWLLLIGGWALCWRWALRSGPGRRKPTFTRLAAMSNARRPRRSTAVVALLSAGAFVVMAVSAFKLDAPMGGNRNKGSGTGGFQLIGSSALPVPNDLTTDEGRKALGLETLPAHVSIVPFRVREGDEASCLNLNRARKPRLLGVRPELLSGRFKFTQAAEGLDMRRGWHLLHPASITDTGGVPEVPAIGDANSIRWSMGKRVGETIDIQDENGGTVRLRIVAAVSQSILQGSLVIDEAAFLEFYPRAASHSYFMIEPGESDPDAISRQLTTALEDFGLEMTSASRRLTALNAVQNTYLGAFQALGWIGLLLGCAGVGLVVLRNVLERRGELAVMMAGGYTKARLTRFVLLEHSILILQGLALGSASAALAILPGLLGRAVPWASLLLLAIFTALNGLLWTWAATRASLKAPLLDTLRKE